VDNPFVVRIQNKAYPMKLLLQEIAVIGSTVIVAGFILLCVAVAILWRIFELPSRMMKKWHV
jgi:hypothetical protein